MRSLNVTEYGFAMMGMAFVAGFEVLAMPFFWKGQGNFRQKHFVTEMRQKMEAKKTQGEKLAGKTETKTWRQKDGRQRGVLTAI